jgi:cytochrome c
MKIKLAIVALTGLTMAGLGSLGSVATVSAQEPTESVNDGVYSLDQAKRGEALYQEQCSACHGPDLAGGEMAPGVVGADFYSGWVDLTLGDLSERIRISMPQNNPQSLSRAQVADILAFMLYRNNYPPGQTDLHSQTEYLNMIKIVQKLVAAAAPADQAVAPADQTPAAAPAGQAPVEQPGASDPTAQPPQGSAGR